MLTTQLKLTAATALLLAIFSGCDNMQAETNRLNAEIQSRESARQLRLARIEEIGQRAVARITRNPAAFAALAAAGYAVAREFKGDGEVVAGIIGVGYCLFNAEECTSLAADLQELVAARQRLESEVSILNTEIARYTRELESARARS